MVLNILFRVLLTFSSTMWIIVIYVIKSHITVWGLKDYLFAILIMSVAVFVAFVNLQLTKKLEKDELIKCSDFSQADNEYIPVYLGYFFVALSVNDLYTLAFVYSVIFTLIVMMNAYFNPVFILFGYHYYHVTTAEGTQIFLICKDESRNPKDVTFCDLRRINNRTYISHKGA